MPDGTRQDVFLFKDLPAGSSWKDDDSMLYEVREQDYFPELDEQLMNSSGTDLNKVPPKGGTPYSKPFKTSTSKTGKSTTTTRTTPDTNWSETTKGGVYRENTTERGEDVKEKGEDIFERIVHPPEYSGGGWSDPGAPQVTKTGYGQPQDSGWNQSGSSTTVPSTAASGSQSQAPMTAPMTLASNNTTPQAQPAASRSQNIGNAGERFNWTPGTETTSYGDANQGGRNTTTYGAGSVVRGGSESYYQPGTPVTERGLSQNFGMNTAGGGTEPTIAMTGGTDNPGIPGFKSQQGKSFDDWMRAFQSGSGFTPASASYSETTTAPVTQQRQPNITPKDDPSYGGQYAGLSMAPDSTPQQVDEANQNWQDWMTQTPTQGGGAYRPQPNRGSGTQFQGDPRQGLPQNPGDWTNQDLDTFTQRAADSGISHMAYYYRGEDGNIYQSGKTGHIAGPERMIPKSRPDVSVGDRNEELMEMVRQNQKALGTDVNQVPPQGGTAYGGLPNHMAGVTAENPAAGSRKNPYGFTPPPSGANVQMGMVPYHNPTTGETWTAPSGGWQPPKNWVKGTAPEPKDQLFGIGDFMNNQVKTAPSTPYSKTDIGNASSKTEIGLGNNTVAEPSGGGQWMNDVLPSPQIYNSQAQTAFDMLHTSPASQMQNYGNSLAPSFEEFYAQASADDAELAANKSIMNEFPEFAPEQSMTVPKQGGQTINVDGGEKAGEYSDRLQDVVGIDSQPSIYAQRRQQAMNAQPVQVGASQTGNANNTIFTKEAEAPSVSASSAAPASGSGALPVQQGVDFEATQRVQASPGTFQMSGTENDQTWNFDNSIDTQALAQAYMSPDFAPAGAAPDAAPSAYEQALNQYREQFPDQPANFGRRTTTLDSAGNVLGQSTGYSNEAESGRLDYQAALINRINKSRRPHFKSLGFNSPDLDVNELMAGARKDVQDGFTTQFLRDAVASGVDPTDPALTARLDEMLGINNADFNLDEDGNPMYQEETDISKYLPPVVEQTEWTTPGIDIRYGRPNKPENEGQWMNPVDAFGNPVKRRNWFGYGPGRVTNTGDQLVSSNVPR